MAEVKVGRAGEGRLVARGVGSCVIVSAWDPEVRIGGMAHVVQPQSPGAGAAGNLRYADQAIPALLLQLRAAGAVTRRLEVKLAGGASLLPPSAQWGREALGVLNVRAVEAALQKHGLRVHASDVGGTHGRNVALETTSGVLRIKTLGRGEVDL